MIEIPSLCLFSTSSLSQLFFLNRLKKNPTLLADGKKLYKGAGENLLTRRICTFSYNHLSLYRHPSLSLSLSLSLSFSLPLPPPPLHVLLLLLRLPPSSSL